MSGEISTTAEAAENAVFARARAVHCDPAAETCEGDPLPASVARKPQERKSPAEWAYQRVVLYLKKFEEGLDADHEVAMGFVSGGGGMLRIQGVGFFAPDLVTFYGEDGAGAKTQLIQHVSQLNVMLKSAPKRREAAMRIGFDLAAQLDDENDDSGGEDGGKDGGKDGGADDGNR